MQECTPVYIVLLSLLATSLCTNPTLDPVVHTTYGPVRGEVVHSSDVIEKYYAFKGIPYAAPPEGHRRFKEPQEPEPWDSIRNSTEYGAKCIHNSVISKKVEGVEDCLFINVLTACAPETWKNEKRPVMVWFHPIFLGSGNFDFFQPDSLLEKFVIVSFNMRLGVMGYLNSKDADAPGNAGLKDALWALKWVKKNIKAFGGDCDNILAVGDEFGTAVLSYLMLTSQSKGLLHKAIYKDTAPLSPWFYDSNPRENAVRLWEYWKPSCENDEELLSCLQSVNARRLVESELEAVPEDENILYGLSPFNPSIEDEGSSSTPIFTRDPEELLKSGKILDIPYMVGYSIADSIYFMWLAGLTTIPSRWNYLEKNFEDIFEWMMPIGLQTKEAVQEMRHFYLGNNSLSNGFYNVDIQKKFVRMTTDLTAWSTVLTAVRMSEAGAKIYFYKNAYEGQNPYFKNQVFNASHLSGVTHGDNLCIVFENTLEKDGESYCDSEMDRSERQAVDQVFFNFGMTGNPTPNASQGMPTWEPFTSSNQEYLYLGQSFVMKDQVLEGQNDFWTKLTRSVGHGGD